VSGGIIDSMGQISNEYEKCLEYSRYLFFDDQIQLPILVVGEEVIPHKVDESEISVACDKIVDAILSLNYDNLEKTFEHYSKILFLACDGRKEDACYYFCSMVHTVERKMREINLKGRNPDVGGLLVKGRQCVNYSQMKHFFGEYIKEYLDLLKKNMENNGKKDIIKAKEYIEAHYNENLTLEILADVVHMNPFYFSSYFKKNAGENFKDYVNDVRIKNAVSLLVSTDMKTYEIAAEVGFRDVRSFTEVFSKYYGETPAAYRKRILSKE
jgi:two-component system response regulator YesN